MRNLAPRQLKSYLAQAQEAPLLLDVREPWEFKICHIDGSELIPMGQIPAAVEQSLDPDREVVVICHHGVRSMQVAAYLERRGFHKVINLFGGVDAWAKEVEPGMPLY